MGGYGSGSHNYYIPRGTIEGRLSLDVRRLHRAGLLAPDTPGSTTWKRGEGSTGSIGHHATGEQDGRATELTLTYALNGEPMTQRVQLEWTTCNYGGHRPWILCPHCGRRVAVLYSSPFSCRHCHDLAHESSRGSAADRGIRKARKIQYRLGGSGNLLAWIMHEG